MQIRYALPLHIYTTHILSVSGHIIVRQINSTREDIYMLPQAHEMWDALLLVDVDYVPTQKNNEDTTKYISHNYFHWDEHATPIKNK